MRGHYAQRHADRWHERAEEAVRKRDQRGGSVALSQHRHQHGAGGVQRCASVQDGLSRAPVWRCVRIHPQHQLPGRVGTVRTGRPTLCVVRDLPGPDADQRCVRAVHASAALRPGVPARLQRSRTEQPTARAVLQRLSATHRRYRYPAAPPVRRISYRAGQRVIR